MIKCCIPSVISELSKNWSQWPITRVMMPWSPFSCMGKYFCACAEVLHLQVQCCSKSCTGCCQSPRHVASCRANSAQQPSSMEDWMYMLLLFYCYNVLQVAWSDKKKLCKFLCYMCNSVWMCACWLMGWARLASLLTWDDLAERINLSQD